MHSCHSNLISVCALLNAARSCRQDDGVPAAFAARDDGVPGASKRN
jgi:hypothetical protein